MRVVKLAKKDLGQAAKKLQAAYKVFAPVKERDFHNFRLLGEGKEPDFDFANTRLSAKHIVYPQSEKMMRASLDPSQENHHIYKEEEKDYSPRAILGIRPCDAKAYDLVRLNFDTPDYKDPYWTKSYDALTRVGLACTSPCATCFCTTAGTGPHDESGLDILLVEDGDSLLAKIITEKGQSLAQKAGWTAEAPEDAATVLEKAKETAQAAVTAKIETDRIPQKKTVAIYESNIWDDLAFACINCGTCTYLCPTCWCFDIQDEVSNKQTIRIKSWDSCMFPLFTIHGTGHNPRPNKVSRVRQRFLHKLKYYPEKYGIGIHCVGCGRCITQCPVNIDIRHAAKLMNEFEPVEACKV
jgi:ferredoxin